MTFFKKQRINRLLNLLFPSECLICNSSLGLTTPICEACFDGIQPLQGSRCRKCGSVLSEAFMDDHCPDCGKKTVHYEKIMSLGEYEGGLKTLIYDLKFRQRKSVSNVLADLFMRHVDKNYFFTEVFVPVPLHPKRQLERGYNQSLLILEKLGKYFRIPVIGNALRRARNTMPQTLLHQDQRMENIKDAFSAGSGIRKVKGRTVLLFDDVYTTGSTINEACRVLKESGAGDIRVLTAAKTA
jgi:competence protein ComFC